ncbi:MAG: phosphoribulokinase [Gammaproteobacteria bacterium]|nr:phosphoribulokinase [Gammaproteobacteria bacterium]
MSAKYPIIAVTGSAGSGITTVRNVFERILSYHKINSVFVNGNSFRKLPSKELTALFAQAEKDGEYLSAFGPEVNLLNRLEGLFREFSRSGSGVVREYLDTEKLAAKYGQEKGTFSSWEEIPAGTDLLLYEGQHGAYVETNWTRREMSKSHNPFVIQQRQKSRVKIDQGVDVAQWVDLLIGIAPNINLEWMQKIKRHCSMTTCTQDDAINTILRRLPDYINYIAPQFSLTDINFQRIPFVDTSNPFTMADIPLESECMLVIRFREPEKYDLMRYKEELPGSRFSRPNTLVVPNGHMEHAIRIICTPIIKKLIENRT